MRPPYTCQVRDTIWRVRYLIESADRLPAWRDDRFLRAKCEGSYRRIEFLGMGGIGKSYLNNQLVRHVGEGVPSRSLETALSPEYVSAFDKVFRMELERRVSSQRRSPLRLSNLRNFVQVMEFDERVEKAYSGQPFSTASGLLHWARVTLAQVATEEPRIVQKVMANRLVVYCTATHPGERSASGLVARGSRAVNDVSSDLIRRRDLADQRLGEVADLFSGLGVPVLRLKLDHELSENWAA